jgi:chromatin remodeling complex protein RSC6|tara:strand:+ start:227 stop:490 length:264 start_codon:yes stop_codon:yes gene_type:complete
MAKKRAVKRKATKTKRKATKTKRKATKTKRKATKAKRKTKKAFGGYSISFKNRDESLEQVFGRGNLAPSEMTKKLWKFIKSKRLANK